jgi:hypothetical protein
MSDLNDLSYPLIYKSVLHVTSEAYLDYHPQNETVPDKIEYIEPEQESKGCVTWIVVCSIFCGLGLAAEGSPAGGFLLTLGFFIIPVIFAIYNNQISKKNISLVDRSIQKYNSEVDRRNTIVKNNKDKLTTRNIIFSQKPKKDILNYIYSDLGSEIREEDNFKVGASEAMFIEYLRYSDLKDSVKSDILVSNDFESYYPDVAIVDYENNIFIDIEIDEPYSFLNKIPIHYIGSDDARNTFFTSIGWTVVRFSEKQIVKQPEKVVEYINDLYLSLRDGMDFKNTNSILMDRRWTKEGSGELSLSNYRNTYLY